MDKAKAIKYCDRAIEISLCAMAFYIPISNALIESFAGLAITAWLVKKIIFGFSLKRLFPGNFLSLSVWVYVAAMFLSALFSSAHIISAKHFVFKTVEYVLLFFIAAEIADLRVLRNVLIAMLFAACLTGIDGIQQFFTHFDFLRHRNQVIVWRINGPFTTPNDFSNYLATLLPLAAVFSFINFNKKWIRPALRVLSVILFVCLVLAATRSAWVAVSASLLLALLFGQIRLFLAGVLLILFVFLTFPFLPAEVRYRATHFFYFHEAGAYFHRKVLWDMGVNMLAQKPIFGQGLGTFMYNFEKFQPAYYPSNWEISYAHNCFLQIAAETGMFGLLSFMAMVSMLFYTCFRRIWSMVKGNLSYTVCGLLLGICAYLVASFFDTCLYSLSLATLFWMMMGLTVAALKLSGNNENNIMV